MVRVRFAPSPTGNLHQGNIRTALFNFLFVKKHQGQFLLRIEDTDVERSTVEFEKSIYEDLRWLGLNWDEGHQAEGENGPYRQSERNAIYLKLLGQLEEKGHVYRCFCSAEELEVDRRRSLAAGKSFLYRGKCRNLSAEDRAAKEAEGVQPSWRFKVEREIIKFQDLVFGEKVFDTATIGDFIIMRSSQAPVYLFSAAVDDALMKITHVIRGEDGVSNTPRQILIQRALGFEPPQFAHLPLILGPDHTLLSKRNGSASVGELRKKGYLPQALLNYLALLGWSPQSEDEFYSLDELSKLFDFDRVARHSAIFDWTKLNHFNQHYLRELDDEAFAQAVRAYLKDVEFSLPSVSDEKLDATLKMLRPNIQLLSELPDWIDLLLGAPKEFSTEAKNILIGKDSKTLLQAALVELENYEEDLSEGDFRLLVDHLKKQTKFKGKQLFLPLRLALTGSEEGPELANLFASLGKEKTMERLNRAAQDL